ncbi:MAG: hypothetical protein KJO61_08945 [Deltaproteobacteria bacterium]|nr:hypothetical protein [Deltaproteobacteria bacterium]
MAVIDSTELINENMVNGAAFTAMAALKAPKMAKTDIKIEILTGDDVLPLAEVLGVLGEASAFTAGDAICGKKAHEAKTPIVEVLLGANTTRSDLNWNCGACGFDTCAEFNAYSKKNFSAGGYYAGPSCNWKAIDFGIAQSWAASAAWQMNIENRMQTSYGVAGMLLGYMEGCNVSVGISLGPCRDQVWYSRPDCIHSFDMEEHEQFMLNCLPQMQVGFTGGGYPQVKHGPDWAADPKFLKMTEDPDWNAKMQDIMGRVGAIIEREKAKKAE